MYDFDLVKRQVSEIKDDLVTKATKDSVYEKERNIMTHISKELKHYVQDSTYQTQLKVIKDDIEGIISKIASASEDLKEIRSFSDIIDTKLNDKLDIDTYEHKNQDIWKEFKKYTSIEAIQRLEAKIGKLISVKI